MTKRQLVALREIRKRLRADKARLIRLEGANESGDLSDAVGAVEEAIEWIAAAIQNDKDEEQG